MADFNMGTARGRILIEYDGQGTRQFREDMEDVQNRTSDAERTFDAAGTAMAGAGVAIAAGFGIAVKSAADFDKRLSAIKAVSGATQQEMQTLRDKALELGSKTAFSATEAASAIEELVKAGVSVPDVMAGAADATVALASAGEIALPEAAAIASAAMNQFKLSAKDMPNIADLIAGAANSSAIDVKDFGYSLSAVGLVANTAGITFKDTAAAIALLGQNGLVGSDAGTSLKTMLSNLIPQSDKAAAELQNLGIITKDGANQFFDAAGKAKPLAEIAELLQKGLKDYTKEQKLATLGTIFGSDAIRAAALIADSGAEGFEKMATAMTKVKAADVAAERLNNLSGSVEQMKGSFETLMIKFGSGSQGPLRDLVEGITAVLDWFNKLDDETQQQIVVAALSAAGFLLLGAAIIKLVMFFQNLAAAIRTIMALRAVSAFIGRLRILYTALRIAVFAAQQALVSWARTAATAVATAARAAATAMRTLAAQALAAGRAMLASVASAARAAAVSLATMAANAARAAASMALMAARAAAFRAASLATAVLAASQAFIAYAASAARAAAATALATARAVAARAAFMAVRAATVAWAVATRLLTAAWATSPFGVIMLALTALAAGLVYAYKNSETFRNIVNAAFKAVRDFVVPIVEAVVGFVRDNWKLMVAILGGPLGIAIGLIIKYWDQIKSVFTTVVNFVINFVKNNWQLLLGILGGPIGLAIALIVKYWDQIRNAFMSAVNAVINFVKNNWKTLLSILGGPLIAVVALVIRYWDQIRSAIMSRVDSIIDVVRRFISTIRNFFSGAGNWLVGAGRAIIQGLMDGIRSAFGALQNLLGRVTSLIPDWKGPMQKDLKLLVPTGKAIMEGLSVGIRKGTPLVKQELGVMTHVIKQEANKGAQKLGSGKVVRNTTPVIRAPVSSGVAVAGSSLGAVTSSDSYITNTYAENTEVTNNYNINIEVNNPRAETASDSINTQLAKTAQLGLLNSAPAGSVAGRPVVKKATPKKTTPAPKKKAPQPELGAWVHKKFG